MEAMKLFLVKFGYSLNNDPEIDIEDELVVAAMSAELAIDAVRSEKIGEKTQCHDDDDNPIEGEFDVVTDFELLSVVPIEQSVDLISREIINSLRNDT